MGLHGICPVNLMVKDGTPSDRNKISSHAAKSAAYGRFLFRSAFIKDKPYLPEINNGGVVQ
ncbi:hypothetical protein EB241_08500 [Erwinia psidii]|uniref:Uncharacterized protein n=1 Tax=Erwinia psidii TaxID=69224 RepID=A0A3N6SLY2_9GAMM|nr:hypothetical protein EB241_08500 [Erwinia psidii]